MQWHLYLAVICFHIRLPTVLCACSCATNLCRIQRPIPRVAKNAIKPTRVCRTPNPQYTAPRSHHRVTADTICRPERQAILEVASLHYAV